MDLHCKLKKPRNDVHSSDVDTDTETQLTPLSQQQNTKTKAIRVTATECCSNPTDEETDSEQTQME
jgi:hypothetical protein